jgi:hypothetical protein
MTLQQGVDMAGHFQYKTGRLLKLSPKLCHSYGLQGFFVAHA